MIRIETPQGDLDLSQSTSIEFNLNSPLFSEDGQIKGDYSLDFTIPDTDANAGKLGNPGLLENVTKFDKPIPVKIYLENQRWISGSLKFKNIPADGFNVNIVAGLSEIGTDLKEKALADVVDKAYVVPTQITDKQVTIRYTGSTTSGTKLSVSIFDAKYEETFAEGETVSTVLQRLVSSFPFTIPLTPTFISPDKIKFVQPGTFNIEQDFFLDAEGFIVDSSFMDLFYDQYALFLADYYQAAPADTDISFPKIYNLRFEKESKPVVLNPGSTFFPEKPSLGGTNGGFSVLLFRIDIAPYPYLRFVFSKIESALGITFTGDFITDPDFAKLILYHSESVSLIKGFVGKNDFWFWRTNWNISEFMPDLKINEFIKRIADYFNLSFEFNPKKRTVKLLRKEDLIKSTSYKDITAIASRYTDSDLNTITGVTLKSKQDAATKLPLVEEADPYAPYIVGTGEKQIEIACSTLAADDRPEVPVDALSIFHAKGASITPKLIYFDSLVAFGFGNYVKASVATSQYSLIWHGENGLYEKWWKNWVRFEQRKTLVKFKANFGIADLINLDWTAKYRIDRVNYLLKSVRIVATIDGLKVADVEAYKT